MEAEARPMRPTLIDRLREVPKEQRIADDGAKRREVFAALDDAEQVHDGEV